MAPREIKFSSTFKKPIIDIPPASDRIELRLEGLARLLKNKNMTSVATRIPMKSDTIMFLIAASINLAGLLELSHLHHQKKTFVLWRS